MEYLRVWLDSDRVGSGWRAVLCVSVGSKLAHLIEPTTGTCFAVPKEDLRGCVELETRPRVLRRQLKRALDNARRYGWRVSRDKLKAARAALGE